MMQQPHDVRMMPHDRHSADHGKRLGAETGIDKYAGDGWIWRVLYYCGKYRVGEETGSGVILKQVKWKFCFACFDVFRKFMNKKQTDVRKKTLHPRTLVRIMRI